MYDAPQINICLFSIDNIVTASGNPEAYDAMTTGNSPVSKGNVTVHDTALSFN